MDASVATEADDLKAKGRALICQAALVDGVWVKGEGEIAVDDPAEETILGSVPKLTSAQVGQAIDGAARAFADYRTWTPIRRAEFLHRWAGLIDENAEAIGALISLENGKPFTEGLGEARYANAFIKWFAGEAERITGAVIETSTGDTVLSFREPVGAVAAITPWNFPAAMPRPARRSPPAARWSPSRRLPPPSRRWRWRLWRWRRACRPAFSTSSPASRRSWGLRSPARTRSGSSPSLARPRSGASSPPSARRA
jgi:hypothetical protein